MAAQTLFNRIVTDYLPSAIPTNLERRDEYALGKVLIYASKPRKLLPWRKHDLKFTGWTLSSLLAAGQTVEFLTTISPLREAMKGAIHFDVRLDYELREALFQLDKKTETKDDKSVCVTADMGKISYLRTDLFAALTSRPCKVNMEHPVVKEAVEKGGALFVIGSVYEAERSVIYVSKDHEHRAVSPSSSEGSSCGEDSLQVTNRDQPTPVAYLLLKMVIGPDGELTPKLNTVIRESVKRQIKPMGAATVPVPNVATVSRDYSGWVMIDIVKEEEEEKKQSSLLSLSSGTSSLGPAQEMPVETPDAEPEEAPEGEPVSEQPVYRVFQPVVHAGIPPEIMKQFGLPEEEPDSGDEEFLHYVYSLKDFQAFTSSTYEGCVKEAEEWVEPILSNKSLQRAFREYIKSGILEKLQKLSTYLQEYGDALRTHAEPPKSTDFFFQPILNALSTDWQQQLDEVTAMIVTAEALIEFPRHTIKKIIALQEDKRTMLLDLITDTPYGTSVHAYADDDPFNDDDLYPIMIYMGYSNKDGTLLYTSPDDTETDILASASVALLAFSTK